MDSFEHLASFVPDHWPRSAPGAPIAFAAVYRTALLPHQPVTARGDYFELDDARAVILLSAPTRPDSRAVVRTTHDDGTPLLSLEQRPDVAHEGGEGVYLYVLVPAVSEINGAQLEPHVLEEHIESAAGLLTSTCGPALAWRREFAAMVLPNGALAAHLGTFRIGLASGPPLVDPESRERVARISGLIARQNAQNRARIQLSLRWWTRSQTEVGTDAFLSCWIALEALSMIAFGKSDLTELRKLMALVYDAQPDEIDALLELTALYRLRNGILHEGSRNEVVEPIVELTGRLFRDLFHWVVREPVQQLALNFLDHTELAMDTTLRETLAEVASASQLTGSQKKSMSIRCEA